MSSVSDMQIKHSKPTRYCEGNYAQQWKELAIDGHNNLWIQVNPQPSEGTYEWVPIGDVMVVANHEKLHDPQYIQELADLYNEHR